MSNTETLLDQPTPTIDDSSCSAAENTTPSADQEKSSSTNVLLNSCSQAMSNVDSQAQSSIQESDVTQSKDNDFHLIKWIEFNFEQLPILLQNVNGPCPLLAIFNILLLQKRVTKTSVAETIASIKFFLLRLSLIRTWM